MNEESPALAVVFELLLNSTVTLSYVGATFDGVADSLERDDARRKLLIVLSYLRLISGGMTLFMLLPTLLLASGVSLQQQNKSDATVFAVAAVTLIITVFLLCLTPLITLSYLGFSFGAQRPLKKDDWRRKWMIVFAWLGIVQVVAFFLSSSNHATASTSFEQNQTGNTHGMGMSSLSGTRKRTG